MSFDPSAAAAAGSGLFGLPFAERDSAVVAIPVPFGATTSYGGGTSRGPAAILAASHQVDLEDAQFGDFWREGIFMREPEPRLGELDAAALAQVDAARKGDAGALERVNALTGEVHELVRAAAADVLRAGRIPAIVGGEHSVSFGAIAAAAEAAGPIGVLQIDAHDDLREAYEGFTWSHASVMRNLMDRASNIERVVSVGVRDFCDEEKQARERLGERWVSFDDLALTRRLAAGEPFGAVAREIARALPERVYVTLDIDGLDPALCPGTGTPVPGGLSWRELVALLDAVAEAKRSIVGFDVVEVAPREGDEWDANVGARALFKLCGLAIRSRGV
jgi:agmatinase